MPRKTYSLNKAFFLARKWAGFTQHKMAKKSGILQPHICDIENGRRPVNLSRLQGIARATKCSFWIRSRGVSILDKEETKMIDTWLDEITEEE